MKRLLFVLLLLSCSSTAAFYAKYNRFPNKADMAKVAHFFSTKEKDNWHTDFNTAAKIARKEKKPLLLKFEGSDW